MKRTATYASFARDFCSGASEPARLWTVTAGLASTENRLWQEGHPKVGCSQRLPSTIPQVGHVTWSDSSSREYEAIPLPGVGLAHAEVKELAALSRHRPCPIGVADPPRPLRLGDRQTPWVECLELHVPELPACLAQV